MVSIGVKTRIVYHRYRYYIAGLILCALAVFIFLGHPHSLMRKNKTLLIYTSVHGAGYLRLLKMWALSIHSAMKYSSYSYEILVMTTSSFELELRNYIRAELSSLNLKVFGVSPFVGGDNFFEGNMFIRHRLYEWDEVMTYFGVIQMDSDVLMNMPPDVIIGQLKRGRFYANHEGVISDRFYGLGKGREYSTEELNRFERLGIQCFNAGIFTFRVDKKMFDELRAMVMWAELEIIRGTPHFADQSFLNVWMNVRGISDTSVRFFFPPLLFSCNNFLISFYF
jgi:hypothetical protein